MEQLILKDQLLSLISIDTVSLFGIRPPELHFILQPSLYFCWFYRDQTSQFPAPTARTMLLEVLSHDLQKSEWRDGTNCQVFVRSLALPEILVFLARKYC